MIRHQFAFDPSGLDTAQTLASTQSDGNFPNEVFGSASEEFGKFVNLKNQKVPYFSKTTSTTEPAWILAMGSR